MQKNMFDPQIQAVTLRPVIADDLPIFFEQQRDPQAVRMAAFTSRDPNDRDAFMAHWQRVLANETNVTRTILLNDQVAGNIVRYLRDGQPEIGYWIGRPFWGRGIATQALRLFIDELGARPLYASAAKDNLASIRVLDKCGFKTTGSGRDFAAARGEEVEEVYFILT